MSKDNFKPDQRVYLQDGTVAYYVSPLPGGGHVVSLIVNGYESDEPTGDETLIRAARVWGAPPITEKSAEVAALQHRVAELRQMEANLRGSIAEVQNALKAQNAALAKWSGFGHLQAFLEGRITHLVFKDYGSIIILPFDKGIEHLNSYGRADGLRLLSLFGDSKGNVSWRINQYYDGSGSNKDVYPAQSAQEADEIAKSLFDAEIAKFQDPKEGYPHGLNYWVETAKKLGLPLPKAVATLWQQTQIATAKHAISEAEKKLAEGRAQLAGITEAAVDESNCPGHVASDSDPKVCGNCGVHIDSLRPEGGAA